MAFIAPTITFRSRYAALAFLTLAAAAPTPLRAATLTTLHVFRGKADGGNPEGGLIIDKNGVLYGTTDIGGGAAGNSGTIFSLTPPATAGAKWTFKVLYRFTGGTDNGYPVGLKMDRNGNLFGYTVDAFGTIFELAKPATAGKPWRLKTLYHFSGGTDGAYPNDVAPQQDGTLIGTTSAGGTGPCTYSSEDPPTGCGVVFRLTPPTAANAPWTETLLHLFTRGADGARPNGAPIMIGGALWGVAVQGGNGDCIDNGTGEIGGCGVVYQLTPGAAGAWTETLPYQFVGGPSGAGPFEGLLADPSGNFYGVTASGGDTSGDLNGNGIVYQLAPAAGALTLHILHSFTGGTDGSHPEGGLLLTPSGKLVGTTEFAPDGYHGTVFSLTQHPPGSGTWSEKQLAKFALPGGIFVTGQIARDHAGALYGVTYQGGNFNQGTVFQVQ
jgi:uncharacterized repeat protein (TIGR03803 family)